MLKKIQQRIFMKFGFKKNIGTTGRIVRLVLGLALLIYAYLSSSWIALACAIFTLIESMMSWCVFNQIFGINSCSIRKK